MFLSNSSNYQGVIKKQTQLDMKNLYPMDSNANDFNFSIARCLSLDKRTSVEYFEYWVTLVNFFCKFKY